MTQVLLVTCLFMFGFEDRTVKTDRRKVGRSKQGMTCESKYIINTVQEMQYYSLLLLQK